MLIYDADCKFCSWAAAWVERHLKVAVQPWQKTDLAHVGLTVEECQRAVQWIDLNEGQAGGAAVATALVHGPKAWPYVGATLLLPTVAPITEQMYSFVAGRRGQLSRLLRT